MYAYQLRTRALVLFFTVELCLITYYLLYSQQGAYAIWQTYQESLDAQARVVQLQQDIKKLEEQRVLWQHYPYYREKIARQQLNMARTTDTVFYIPKQE